MCAHTFSLLLHSTHAREPCRGPHQPRAVPVFMVAQASTFRVCAAAVFILAVYHVLVQRFSMAASTTTARPCSAYHIYKPKPFHAATAAGTATASSSSQGNDKPWKLPPSSNLQANPPAELVLGAADPKTTTLHFTFGSVSMMPFLRNWHHFVKKVGLNPVLVGAADVQMLEACTAENVAALGIVPGLDPWTYTRGHNVSTVVQSGKSEWKYYRHHKTSFLELGLVKAAFLWELLNLGYDVLISDLDVVWLGNGWEHWMTYRNPLRPPLREASLQAMADVLVSTDELDEDFDAHGRWERWPFGVGWGWRAELNTGVVHFRATNGSRAFVQAWRRAMLAKREVENTNDQFIFCAMVRDAGMEPVTSSRDHMEAWRASLSAEGLLRSRALEAIAPSTRGVSISRAGFPLAVPCLPEQEAAERGKNGHAAGSCKPTRFTLGTLPLRAFTGGHTYFMQGVRNREGHSLPRAAPLTVHFTFQYSDTPDFPHGKRQRAREAGLWAVDPPEYFTDGRFVRLVGPLYTAEQRVAIERRFPEWSPQRHMHLDAIQRAAIRDLLALATALNATMIMPPLDCFCDRYWGFTQNCRMPTAPPDMRLPFRCSQDALFEIKFWNDKQVAFREAGFLDHPAVPRDIPESAVRVSVHENQPSPRAGAPEARFATTLRPGTPMSEVNAAVRAANPDARLIEIGVEDIRRLCKWLGSTAANRAFNAKMRYVLHESSRYCPGEDHRSEVANIPNWNWRNPFTAYNCTWGFATPSDYPEPEGGLTDAAQATRAVCGSGAAPGRKLVERDNSTTCARAMLCDVHVTPEGKPSRTLEQASRCNLEGYGGLDYETYGAQVKAALATMPGGRCPMPPGDVPGPGGGLDPDAKYDRPVIQPVP